MTPDDAPQWLLDCADVQALFERARIDVHGIVPEGGAVVVTVPPQKDVLGRIKRLADAMTDEAQFSINYAVKVDAGTHYYTLTRRNK